MAGYFGGPGGQAVFFRGPGPGVRRRGHLDIVPPSAYDKGLLFAAPVPHFRGWGCNPVPDATNRIAGRKISPAPGKNRARNGE